MRGPAPHRVVQTARSLGARSVRGNHEHRLLEKTVTGHAELDAANDAVHAALDEADWAYLRDMPLWIDLPDHDARIVHAGVVPGVPIASQNEVDLLFMRALDDRGRPVRRRGEGTLWGTRYAEHPHVLFGHHALESVQLHAHATGLDTGCVYGGALTALVLEEGQAIPPVEQRANHLVSQPARRAYAPR